MSEHIISAITTFTCNKCKRAWVKLEGDIILPPEPCPFCGRMALRCDLAEWLSLARRQYAEMNHGDGICPTLNGINQTEKLLNVELT